MCSSPPLKGGTSPVSKLIMAQFLAYVKFENGKKFRKIIFSAGCGGIFYLLQLLQNLQYLKKSNQDYALQR